MRILAINPGSTSTKIACGDGREKFFEDNLPFTEADRAKFPTILDQLETRFEQIAAALDRAGISASSFDAVVGRGGLLAPIPSGTYTVCGAMEDYLRRAPRGEHASNLGAFLSDRFAELSGCPAFIVDPVSVDELSDVARISGAPEIERPSLVHALNQKAVARDVAAKLGKRYEDCRFIVAHLGTGITIGAHTGGRIVDVVGAKSDGPFSPERAGGLPADKLADLCFSGKYTQEELEKKLLSGWGLVAYLGTRDLRGAFRLAERDERAATVIKAFAYQIAKGVGELAAALDGDIDAVILTGGLAQSQRFMDMLVKKIKFLGRIEIVPGEDEMKALTLGALRVLNGEERAKDYVESCAKQRHHNT